MAVRPEQQKRSEDDERLAEAAEIGDRLLDNVWSVLRGKRGTPDLQPLDVTGAGRCDSLREAIQSLQ